MLSDKPVGSLTYYETTHYPTDPFIWNINFLSDSSQVLQGTRRGSSSASNFISLCLILRLPETLTLAI